MAWQVTALVWRGGAMCGGMERVTFSERFLTRESAETWWAARQADPQTEELTMKDFPPRFEKVEE